jgi:hypothetical protein
MPFTECANNCSLACRVNIVTAVAMKPDSKQFVVERFDRKTQFIVFKQQTMLLMCLHVTMVV